MGRKGTGKTYLLRELLDDVERLLLFDPNGEYGSLVPQPAAAPSALPRWRLVAEAFHILGWHRLAELAQVTDAPGGDGEPPRQVIRSVKNFELFMDLVREADGWSIAIDEAHHYWERHRVLIDELVRTMRHRQQDWFMISHRASWIPKSVISQVDVLILFQTTSGGDLKFLAAEFEGIDPDELRGLGIGEYVELTVSRRETWK